MNMNRFIQIITRNIFLLIIAIALLVIFLPIVIIFVILYMIFGGGRYKGTFINFGPSTFGRGARNEPRQRPSGGTKPSEAVSENDAYEAEFKVISSETIDGKNGKEQ